MDYSTVYGFLVSLGIGALLGVERERHHAKDTRVAGARTFMLIALLGTTTGLIADSHPSLIPPLLTAGVLTLIALGYYVSWVQQKDIGLTTEVTEVMVFALGFLSYYPESRNIAVMLGILTAILLTLKESIQEFAKDLEKYELVDTLKFCVIAFIILPLLPDQTIDPWGVVNPHELWLLVVLISTISYFGYILVKILGPDRGIGLTGFLGGLTSSTAVTTAMASKVRENHSLIKPTVFAVLVAWSVMFPRIILEVGVVNSSLLGNLLAPIGAMFAVGIISSIVVWHRKTNLKAEFDLKTPFAIKPALKFAAFFLVILIISSVSRTYFGTKGLYASSLIAGIADIDAITLSTAKMAANGEIDAQTATNAITLAAIVNTIMKLIYARILGTKEFWKTLGIATAFIITTGLITMMLF